jgi:protein tyrosine phosphatase (PTP) superfamily phosphohydrolase (DUF442 family)
MTTDIEASYNFRMISDRLTTSGVVGANRLGALASQGYEVVVNLLPDSSEHAVSNEQDIVESQRIEYIYIPVDFKAPGRSDLTRFSEALDRLSDSKIHIHCAANYRVSAFYSLYAASRGDWSTDQATDFIHSVWRPADYPGWSEFIDEILGELQ